MNQNFCTETATVVTASSANTNFPASNLKHPFRSKRWRTTGVDEESVVFDLVTTEPIDSVVLLWPKEDGIRLSETAVIRIQANATNVWTSPAINEVITIDNTYVMGSHYFTGDQNYRYWRVWIDDPDNPNGFIEVGLVWLGKSLDVENAQNGFKFDLVDKSKTSMTDFGHSYVDEYPLVAAVEFTYQNMDYSAIQILENAYRENRTLKPVMILIDPEEAVFNKDHFAVYGKFKPSFGVQHVSRDIMNTDGISVVEMS